MGSRGPVPNHSADLARDRSRKGGDQQEITKGVRREVEIPDADPNWHPIARMLWDSLRVSGQSDFYQQSDWAFAYSVCEDLHQYKMPRISSDGEPYFKRSGQMLQAIYSAMSNLLVTEGDRRRVRIELEEPTPDETPAAVLAIADYKNQLGLATEEASS